MTVPAAGFAPAICYLRTEAERRDQRRSWARPDRAFFAAGACHVLAFRFLRRQAGGRFAVVLLRPDGGLPGMHAYATDGVWAFDFNGWVPEATLLQASEAECRRRWPAWRFERIAIDPAVDLEDFCAAWGHRFPADFAGDVVQRADRYLDGFPPEPPAGEAGAAAGSGGGAAGLDGRRQPAGAPLPRRRRPPPGDESGDTEPDA